MSKTIVIYYTFEGNAGFAAQTAAEATGAALEQLRVEKEPPRRGPGKFLRGGSSALRQEDPGLAPIEADLAAYDAVVLAFPIWAGTYPPAVGAFLRQYDLTGKDVRVIACSASGKADKAIGQLRERLGDGVKDSLSLVSPLRDRDTAAARIRAFLGEAGQ